MARLCSRRLTFVLMEEKEADARGIRELGVQDCILRASVGVVTVKRGVRLSESRMERLWPL